MIPYDMGRLTFYKSVDTPTNTDEMDGWLGADFKEFCRGIDDGYKSHMAELDQANRRVMQVTIAAVLVLWASALAWWGIAAWLL